MTMTPDQLKRQAAEAAIAWVAAGSVIGVGTGSTVNHFIEALARMPQRIKAAVSSSSGSSGRLRALGIDVVEANAVDALALYVDGADEIDHRGHMIKGGGAALTREKIVADISVRFICIADESKLVTTLGRFPVPVEVIPMASASIARRIRAIGGEPVLRAGVVTDNGCPIIDARGLPIDDDPASMEREINQWPGVVSVGIFARNKAAVCLLGSQHGVQTITF